jgi:type VI secretion system protein ImpA
MTLREDILEPIAGGDPSGPSLRLSAVYDDIKEARREDDGLAQGAWQHERKIADHGRAIRLAQDALATQSKDLQLAAWLCDSLVKQHGIRGLRDGLVLCQRLLERFWETLHPRTDDGEMEDRLAPLEWLGSKLIIPIKHVPLCRESYDFFQYQESRGIEYEEAAKTKDQKATREKSLKEGKLAPELFDRSFAETAKAFYADTEKQIDEALEALRNLDQTCVATFGNESAPSFTRVEETLQQVRHVVHQLLQKKQETEPDPVVKTPPPAPVERTPGAAKSPAATAILSRDPRFGDARDTIAAIPGPAVSPRGRDPHERALEAMKAGKLSEAIGILQREMEREPTGRDRFQRKLQLAHICLAAGKDTIAQPLLDDIAAIIETHKLDDWEESGLVAAALALLIESSKKIQGDAKAKQGLFERICRLDPVRALSV